jgi:hypothetical protein
MKNGGAAFPVCSKFPGELRDWFAGQAMAGIAAELNWFDHTGWDAAANCAYSIADAMIARREKEESNESMSG